MNFIAWELVGCKKKNLGYLWAYKKYNWNAQHCCRSNCSGYKRRKNTTGTHNTAV